MALIGFRKIFVDKVVRGTKRQTIRAERKRPFRVGERLYLYTGLRTKKCRKLGEVTCKEVKKIIIDEAGYILHYSESVKQYVLAYGSLKKMAIADGFVDWEDLKKFFKKDHKLPFTGVLVKW